MLTLEIVLINKMSILILIIYCVFLWMQKYKNKAVKSNTMGSTGTTSTNVLNNRASTDVANIKRMRDSRNQNLPGLLKI